MILVVGSTGYLGSAVARTLATAGRPVVGLVRDPESTKARTLASAGVRLAVGDLKDPGSLERALEGVDTVICTASATLSRREGDSIETVDRRGVQSLIQAAEKAGVRDFVYVSFDHARQSTPLAAAKREGEAKLKATKLNWTILQPSCFCEVWFSPAVGFDVAEGKVRIYGEGTSRIHYIPLGDVVKAVVASLGNPAAARRTFRIGGAPRTALEAVKIFEGASGRRFTLEHMPIAAIQAGRASAPDPLTESFFGLFEMIATTGDSIDPQWEQQLGVTAQTLEDWANASKRDCG